MSESRIVQNIFELLKQAQETTDVVLTIEERPTIVEMEGTDTPENCWAGRQSMNRLSRALDRGEQIEGGGRIIPNRLDQRRGQASHVSLS